MGWHTPKYLEKNELCLKPFTFNKCAVAISHSMLFAKTIRIPIKMEYNGKQMEQRVRLTFSTENAGGNSMLAATARNIYKI